MKKIVSLIIVCVIAMMAYAVPARRGWQTRTQADGTTIEVQQFGDEYYHYFINREGKELREVDGQFQVVGEAPTPEVAKARRVAAKAKRTRQATTAEFGYTPYLPPKGVVIMVNYSDKSFKSTTTKAVIDELCNSTNCTVNKYSGVNYGSIGQYFRDQSDGKYNLQLDVYGPVTLDHNYAYYGEDDGGEGNDKLSGDVIIEACKKMDSEIDFSQYDWNNDGKVDFVYVVYAGKGQADGGDANTIWPHSFDIASSRYYGNCTYSETQCKFDGKLVHNYAMSNELSGSSLAGIGIICHEYGHVIGLPDHYDTDYSTNYDNSLTPNEWDVMDGGSYNGNIHCPPNYNAWEKAFCGWYTPENLGNDGRLVEMKPIGTEGYSAYQINSTGKQQAVTTNNSTNYYIECRQQQGWDKYLPAAGMLIWKVNYNKNMWANNTPNNTSNGDPHFTLVIPSGTGIGESYGAKNAWPYSTTNSWSGVSGKPLKDIKKSGNNISLVYIEEPLETIEPFDVQWYSNGTLFETNQCTEYGKVVLPTSEPAACNDRVFIGWCANASYESATKAPTLVKAGDAVQEGAKFYAIFATQTEGGGDASFDGTTGGNFKIYANVNGTKYYAVATVSNNKLQSTTSEASAANFVLTPVTGGFTIQTGNKYLSHGSGTNVSLSNSAYTWAIATGTKGSWRVNSSSAASRALAFRASTYNVFGGYATGNINGTEYFDLEIGGGSGVSLSDYSTMSGCGTTGIEDTMVERPAAVKVIREGRIVIIRGDEEFTITGERIR